MIGPARDLVLGVPLGMLAFGARANRAVLQAWVRELLGLDGDTTITALTVNPRSADPITHVAIHHGPAETTTMTLNAPLHALTRRMVVDACRHVRMVR